MQDFAFYRFRFFCSREELCVPTNAIENQNPPYQEISIKHFSSILHTKEVSHAKNHNKSFALSQKRVLGRKQNKMDN